MQLWPRCSLSWRRLQLQPPPPQQTVPLLQPQRWGPRVLALACLGIGMMHAQVILAGTLPLVIIVLSNN